ncbi:hypothetical protein [Kaarinaea lacus]
MSKLAGNITKTANMFRIGAEGEGSRGLLEILSVIAATIETGKKTHIDIKPEDLSLFNKIVQAQERGDFIYVADLLEYKLPSSSFWQVISD